ncbi:hypothetical protein WJX74_000522 [Apatococcus lobatus]|uniref:Protein kinase domain-containing protein n=1 Tax=Apatococcus lobatus TaxID=904363 RepID=A0AAW1SEN7_9CHLO
MHSLLQQIIKGPGYGKVGERASLVESSEHKEYIHEIRDDPLFPGKTTRVFSPAYWQFAKEERAELRRLGLMGQPFHKFKHVAWLMQHGQLDREYLHVYPASTDALSTAVVREGSRCLQQPFDGLHSQKTGLKMVRQLGKALHSLASNGCIAQNVVPENIWRTCGGNILLVGLGGRTYLGHGRQPYPSPAPGPHSEAYQAFKESCRAPELAMVEAEGNASGTLACAVRSLGCMYALSNGIGPVPCSQQPLLHYKQYPNKALLRAAGGSRRGARFLHRVLAKDPAQRGTLDAALLHPAILRDRMREGLYYKAGNASAEMEPGNIPSYGDALDSITVHGSRRSARSAAIVARDGLDQLGRTYGLPEELHLVPCDLNAVHRRLDEHLEDLDELLLAVAVALPQDEAQGIRARLAKWLPDDIHEDTQQYLLAC